MRKFTKKLLVCLMAALIGILPGIVTDTKAAAYQWSYDGNYSSLEEAGTYSIINSDQAAVAVDGSINLSGEGSEYDKEGAVYEWTASNENLKMDVSSDQRSAKITGVRKGNTKVTLKITYKDENAEESEEQEEQTVEYNTEVEVTTPTLKSSKIGLAINTDGYKVEVTGNSSCGQDRILYGTDNNKSFSVYDGTLYATKKQTRNVYVYVDGIILKAVVKCTDPKIEREIAVLKKGQSASFALKGTSGYTPVTYSVKNKNYATVSKTGKVKAKKYGKTTLTVQADNQTWQLNVYIVKSSIYKTISKAYTIEKAKTKYSQPRRMQKGYADCSSYVWKSYKTAGIYFGDKGYAPTAANIAKWCSKNHKSLKLSSYNKNSDKLKPGDLIFYKKRVGKNGRYKNIEHVSMYIGNDTILHASGKMVSFGYPWYRKVIAIGRPVK